MFDKICEKLFGVGKENQEKLIIKLCVISVLMFFIAIILNTQTSHTAWCVEP